MHEPMARRGWVLFAAMSVIWGIVSFKLIAEIGPTRATLITLATVGGFVLVITGCRLATRGRAPVVVENEPPRSIAV